MQPDSALATNYAKDFDYETGASRKSLTGTDTVSWHDKASQEFWHSWKTFQPATMKY